MNFITIILDISNFTWKNGAIFTQPSVVVAYCIGVSARAILGSGLDWGEANGDQKPGLAVLQTMMPGQGDVSLEALDGLYFARR